MEPEVQKSKKISRRALVTAGIGAAAGLTAVGAAVVNRNKAAGGPVVLRAGMIDGELPVADPASRLWRKGSPRAVTPLPQNMYFPKITEATITDMSVRALWNGTEAAFLLEWSDPQADELEAIVRFRDAVACMLPVDPASELPPIFMGMAGKPVYIVQWKASWQKDMDEGHQGVEKAYPNWFNDVYPGHPTLAKLGMTPETAQLFYPGLEAGNPLSQLKRTTAAEELVAEGFGTLTPMPQQRAQARGVYENGRWQVSIGVPRGEGTPALKPGTTVPTAFAVWNGGDQQRGGRKHFIDWVQVELPGG